ncbi:MAG: alpha-amylase family glycosyl hydrolase [Myxococcota bacterium]
MSEPWWKSAVVYQIYPRSFCDAGGTGVGDLSGIRQRLDHLVWLGVDALWLSPFFRSPMADFGYDVSDYCDVDPLFGSLADFDRLLESAHSRGLRVLIDWVPAHTSSEHPWFVEARSRRSSEKRDWYIWRDPPADGSLPNNWRAAFLDLPAWTFDEATGQYYLHSFLPEQPDLNWANPDLRAAMHDVLRFWLDRGVDGFRADVVHNIGKDPSFASLPPERARIPAGVFNDQPVTHEYLREIRRLLDSYPGERVMVGEVTLSTARVAAYYGRGDELHLNFNFIPMHQPWDGARWREWVGRAAEAFEPVDAWPTWVLSNHDTPRHRTRYGSEARGRAAAVLLLGLRGTPFLYQGEELGLEDAVVPEDREVDPGGRDGCRAPLPWDAEAGHGWGAEAWLPFPPEAGARSVETQRAEPDSVLQLYRRLLRARRGSRALMLGRQVPLEAPEGVLAWSREADRDVRVVAVNYRAEPRVLGPAFAGRVEVASDGAGEGRSFAGTLGPDQALVLRPESSRG